MRGLREVLHGAEVFFRGGARRVVAALVPPPRQVALTWAARLQRVFGIEIEQCARCGGRLQVIASIEQPELIARILTHRREAGCGGGVDLATRAAGAAAGGAVLMTPTTVVMCVLLKRARA